MKINQEGFIKNNLKIMMNAMHECNFRKMQDEYAINTKLEVDSRLKQETQKIFLIFMIF